MSRLFLVLLAVGVVIPFRIAAQEADPEMEMFFAETEVVTAPARHEQPIGLSPSAVTVLTREDITSSGAESLVDLLRQVPGLDVIINTPAYSSLSARLDWTNENNQLLVLIDGREANFEVLGITIYEMQPITLADIERIEIIRGPASALYGANALSGVVSITTRAAAGEPEERLELRGGEVGSRALHLQLGHHLGDWQFRLSGGLDFMDSFSLPGQLGRQVYRLRPLVSFAHGEHRLLLDGGLAQGDGWLSLALSGFSGDFLMTSLRAEYRYRNLRAQVYWQRGRLDVDFHSDLELNGVLLARLVPLTAVGHVADWEVQWTLPEFWRPLLLMVGGNFRASTLSSAEMLEAGVFDEPTSPGYRRPGIDELELRGGVFGHAEWQATDWLTITGGLRLDGNTTTGWFLSPRLAAVTRLGDTHFLRLGASRSFRKPSFFETSVHLMVDFPPDSPITGDGRQEFLDFMTRVVGNSRVGNEQLWSFEAGYQGSLFSGRLELGLDLYYNIYLDELILYYDVAVGANGLPDLQASSIQYRNADVNYHFFGCELYLRFRPRRDLVVDAAWTQRYALRERAEESPQNLLVLGARYLPDWGLVASLYASSRSDFWNYWVTNPEGILEPFRRVHLPNQVVLLGRLGWSWQGESWRLESGAKLFLPISWEAPHLRVRELGGGTDARGRNFGSDLLRRVVTLYMEGSF